MFYAKNVPIGERALRAVIGAACLGYAALNAGSSGLAVGVGVVGVVLAATGWIGFCPMCALAGRRLDKRR